MDNFDCSINNRFFYSSLEPLYECQNIRVFQGLDHASNTRIFIKLIDDDSFQESDRSCSSSAKQHWRQYNVQLYANLAASNAAREFSQKVIDIIALSQQRTAIIFSCSNTLGTLANSLHNAKGLDEPDALLVLKYVALGIQEFHSKGFIHGSICLDNIAITEGSFEVTSHALNGIEYQNISEQQELESRQSLFYLAPEILEIYDDPSQILLPTVLSDSWALGVLFFRLLRGKFLYAGDSSDDVLDAIFSHNTQLPGWLDVIQEKEGDFPHQISKQSEQLLSQLLSRDPQRRPSISDVLSSELLQLIRLPNKISEFDKTIFKSLPSSILAQSTFFSETKLKNDLNGYACEELYFGIGLDGPVRLKIINLSSNNEINEQYMLSLQKFRSLSIKDTYGRNLLVNIKEVAKSPGKLFLLIDYSSQGSLHEYLARRKNTNQRSVWEINGALVMHRLLNTMIKIHPQIQFLCGLFAKNVYVHQGMARIGEPMLLNEAVLSEKKSMIDILAPECKQIAESMSGRYDYPKGDIWNFGILLYKMIYGEDPIFDLQQKPIFPQQQQQGASDSLKSIICSCLSYSEIIRPDWETTTKLMEQQQNDQKYNLIIYQISNLDEMHFIGSEDDQENMKQKRKSNNNRVLNNKNKGKFNEGEGDNNKGKYFQKGQKRKSQLYGEYDAQSQKTASDSYTNGFGNFNRPTEDDGGHFKEEEFIVLPRAAVAGEFNVNQSNVSDYQLRDFNEEDEGIIADYEPPRAVTQKIQFNSKNKNTYLSKVQMVKGNYVNSAKLSPFENLNVKDSQIIASNVLQEYLPPEELLKPMKNTPEIIPTQSFGGSVGRVVKIGIKISAVLILFFALFFRSSVVNSWDAIGNQGNMKVITANVVTGTHSQVQQSQIISLSTGQFMKTSVNFSSMKMLNGCLDNLAFEEYTNEKSILNIFNSAFFFFYAFFCFLSFLSILAAKCYHMFKLDWYTVIFNARNGVLSPQNKHLIAAQIFAHFEFSFVYYCHYQIFNLFYYIQFDPCLGVSTTTAGLPILTETSQLILGGRTGYFFAKIVCTLGLFGFLHYVFILAFIKNPLRMSEILGQRIHLVTRLASYIFGCWFLCRIGLFLVFQPTYSYDRIGFISATLGNGESQSVFGFIPEITELILITVDVLIEVLFNLAGTQIKNKINSKSRKRKREEEQQIQFKQNPIGILENVKGNMRMTLRNNNRVLSRNPSFQSKQIDSKLFVQ